MTENKTNMNSAPNLSDAQWNQLQSQIQQHWSQVDERALLATQGDFGKVVALIEQQTGENRQRIETTLRQLIDREPESEVSAGAGGRVR